MNTKHYDSHSQGSRGANKSVTPSLPVEGGVRGAVRVCLAVGNLAGNLAVRRVTGVCGSLHRVPQRRRMR